MKYTVEEYSSGFKINETEYEGRIPNIHESIRIDGIEYFVSDVVTDLTYPEPVYIVKIRDFDDV